MSIEITLEGETADFASTGKIQGKEFIGGTAIVGDITGYTFTDCDHVIINGTATDCIFVNCDDIEGMRNNCIEFEKSGDKTISCKNIGTSFTTSMTAKGPAALSQEEKDKFFEGLEELSLPKTRGPIQQKTFSKADALRLVATQMQDPYNPRQD